VDARVGLYAAWALLFAIQFTWQAKKAQIDPLVVFFITLSCYGLLRHAAARPGLADCGRWAGSRPGWARSARASGVIALLMLPADRVRSLRGWPRRPVHARSGKFWLGPLAFLAAAGCGWCRWCWRRSATAVRNTAPTSTTSCSGRPPDPLRQSWDHGQPPWYFIEVR
jgi:4-amino-4-deoxy-L-arabinose transferase-like glycosyltransferase